MSESGRASEWLANWTVQMRKGLLDFCILRALEGGEHYGYALVKMLVAVPGIGVAEGSIYPLLARLKRQGLVATRLEESSEGPARKYYRLTEEGRRMATEMGVYFESITRGVEALGGEGLTQSPAQDPARATEANEPERS